MRCSRRHLLTHPLLRAGEKLLACTWLQRRESSEGRSGKGTNPPHTDTLSLGCSSLAISCSTPVLQVPQYLCYSSMFSLGINLMPCQRPTPSWKQNMEQRKGSPTAFSLSSLCAGCFKNHMLFLLTPKEDFARRRTQPPGRSGQARARIRGHTYKLDMLCSAHQPNKGGYCATEEPPPVLEKISHVE